MQLLAVVLCAALLHQADCTQPEVVIQQGTVRGLFTKTVSGRVYSTFLGIPYAKPPVGKHRFKEPVPAEPWAGVYNATREAPKCMQLHHRLMNTPFAIHGSEDCLYINVYTPQLSTDGKQKPLDVIAFIHGGAFMFLSSTIFGADILLDRDVVLVTFNYRLGPLGFLSTGDEVVPGNNGMKDQVLALQWIQKNIAVFGGDPARVTLVGFSAGGASVHFHVLSPLSRGLFNRAMCLSGTSLNPWTMAEGAREKARLVGKELGCPAEDSTSMIKCLRTRPAEHVVETTKHFLHWLYNPFSPYALVVEPPGPNAFLPDSPINIIKQGNASDVPMLFMFCKEEGLYPGAELVGIEDNLNELKSRWNELLPYVLDYSNTVTSEEEAKKIALKVKDYYKVDFGSKEGVGNIIKLLGDRIFNYGIAKTVKLHASLYKSPVYLYKFSYSGEYTFSTGFGGSKEMGVSHADDILYVLSINGLNTHETDPDREVSKYMTDLWVSFAANGTSGAEEVGQHLPKIALTEIRGPGDIKLDIVDDLGEEAFWDSLGLSENVETGTAVRDEL